MKFSRYVKDKINYTLGFIVYCMIIIAYKSNARESILGRFYF